MIRKWSGKQVSFFQAGMIIIPISTIHGLGTSTWLLGVPLLAGLLVWRHRIDSSNWTTARRRNIQALIVVTTLIAAVSVIWLILSPLVGSPDFMATASSLPWKWVLDRSSGSLPSAWVVSLPIWSWKIAMGMWLVWLVRFSLPWVRRGWSVFTQDGVWPQAVETEEPFEDDHEYDSASDEDSRRDD